MTGHTSVLLVATIIIEDDTYLYTQQQLINNVSIKLYLIIRNFSKMAIKMSDQFYMSTSPMFKKTNIVVGRIFAARI